MPLLSFVDTLGQHAPGWIFLGGLSVLLWKAFVIAANVRSVYQSVGGKNGKGSLQERMNRFDDWREEVDATLIEQNQILAELRDK